MSTKISCGGFYIDDETLSLSDDNKLSVKGGGSGGGSEVLIVHNETGILDKTWQEISDAVGAGSVCAIYDGDSTDLIVWYLTGMFADDGEYGVGFIDLSSEPFRRWVFIADSADGYPVIDTNPDDPEQH